MDKFLLLSLGAILGANSRYWIGIWCAEKWGTEFPYGTLLINITGSFVLGLFMTLTTEKLLLDPRWRFFFAIGFLGAYTTFSTYTYESYSMLARGQWITGMANLLGSSILGLLSVGLGALLGKNI
ncbi:MAG: fluoride efflux transporter CrcB [Leptolinea sp.]|jgi:CrcB protein|nr:fluoride efflux transporter CrcB [Leptolinea sp.]